MFLCPARRLWRGCFLLFIITFSLFIVLFPTTVLSESGFLPSTKLCFFSSACPATCYICPSGCTLNSIKETTGHHRLIKYVQHLITCTKGCQPLQEVDAALPLHVESRDWFSLLFNRSPRHL